MTSPDSPLRRRAAFIVLSSSLVALALAACGVKPKQYGPGEKPFWEREDQRD
jgi:hypothetical protein